ncbi:unnamed protein product, partial [Ectocarpus sp. 12 AP-2014]
SYCVARGVQECHYSIRSFPGMSSSMIASVVPASGEVGELSLPAGLSFWATDEGAADDAAEMGEPRSTVSGVSGTAVGEATGFVLPLKRVRLSPSPATGLPGLLENELLGDFFGCLGFLPLASESDVRGAMVSVMRANNVLNQRGAASCWPSPAAAGCG